MNTSVSDELTVEEWLYKTLPQLPQTVWEDLLVHFKTALFLSLGPNYAILIQQQTNDQVLELQLGLVDGNGDASQSVIWSPTDVMLELLQEEQRPTLEVKVVNQGTTWCLGQLAANQLNIDVEEYSILREQRSQHDPASRNSKRTQEEEPSESAKRPRLLIGNGKDNVMAEAEAKPNKTAKGKGPAKNDDASSLSGSSSSSSSNSSSSSSSSNSKSSRSKPQKPAQAVFRASSSSSSSSSSESDSDSSYGTNDKTKKVNAKKIAKKPAPILKPLTFEEQKTLSVSINDLPREHLGGVIDIIRSATSVDSDDYEIDLEIDQLDIKTQRTLMQHVSKVRSVLFTCSSQNTALLNALFFSKACQ
jgi:hypothetical protein